MEVKVGDTVFFSVFLGGRKTRSKSKVYGFTTDGNLLVSCNGVKKTFVLKQCEVTKHLPK